MVGHWARYLRLACKRVINNTSWDSSLDVVQIPFGFFRNFNEQGLEERIFRKPSETFAKACLRCTFYRSYYPLICSEMSFIGIPLRVFFRIFFLFKSRPQLVLAICMSLLHHSGSLLPIALPVEQEAFLDTYIKDYSDPIYLRVYIDTIPKKEWPIHPYTPTNVFVWRNQFVRIRFLETDSTRRFCLYILLYMYLL